MIVVIFGPPGSGKGTQSRLLLKKYNLLHLISVGDLLRSIIKSESDLGKKIQGIVESGNLIPNDIICDLLDAQLRLVGANILLDGFPRNLYQAHFLTEFLQKKMYTKGAVFFIELHIDDDIIMTRLHERIVCTDCNSIYMSSSVSDGFVCNVCSGTQLIRRADDISESVVNNRIREYHLQMLDLHEYYGDKLLRINASCSIAEVANNICQAIGIAQN